MEGATNIHLVDVARFGALAFDMVGPDQTSLRSVLTGQLISKVFFDVRNACNALFYLFDVELAAVQDLQLMELAQRYGSKRHLAGLQACIHQAQIADCQHVNNVVLMHDGRNQFLDERYRRHRDAQRYVGDVTMFPQLYSLFTSKLQPRNETFWRYEVQNATAERLKLAVDASFDARTGDQDTGPWDEKYIEEARETWNEEILDQVLSTEERQDVWNTEILIEALVAEEEEDPCDEPSDSDDDHAWVIDNHDYYQDTARDCIGWEEDMIRNGEPY